jgi:predicted flap endonuclease-1-like 5' DNA nuclease
MSGLMCCLGWFVAGLLLGWLLNWLFDKFFRRGGDSGGNSYSMAPAPVAAPVPRPVAPPAFVAPPAAPVVAVPVPVPVPVPASSAPVVTAASLAAAAAAFGFSKIKSSNGYDNFEIIEGIGPKINDVMHNAGVHTFAALAAMDIPSIAKILDAAGPNFKLANPETWAQQSSMCAAGHWEKLKVLQDELIAGVSMKKDNT